MHLDSATIKKGDKKYTRHLLRETYREGKKVKHRTIANLSHCKPEEIEAIRLALRHKKDLAGMLGESKNIPSLQAVSFKQGLSVGAIWLVYAMARQLGITMRYRLMEKKPKVPTVGAQAGACRPNAIRYQRLALQ